jgi:hypothetical protein
MPQRLESPNSICQKKNPLYFHIIKEENINKFYLKFEILYRDI